MTERTLRSCDGTHERKQPSLGSIPISLRRVRGDGCLAAAACVLGCNPESVPTTEAETMCKRNRKARTERRNAITRTYYPDCMCWKCGACRPKLQSKWISHVLGCFKECGTRLVVVAIPVDDFARFSRRLSRNGANYARVRRELEYVLFVSTNNEAILACGVEVSLQRASELFTEMVMQIQDSSSGNPVSTSRKWSLPSKEHSGWDLVAVGPTPEQVRHAAKVAECAEAIKCLDRTINGLTVTICSGPTLAVDRLCEMVAAMATNHPKECSRQRYKNSDMDCDVSGHNDPYFSSLYGPSNIELAT